jgi:two-component system chemotaxis response regulator CheB
MDVYLQKENGLDVAAELMREQAVPILAVTAANPEHPDLVYRAMEAGVLDVCAKLPSPDAAAYPVRRAALVRLVRALSRVPVVHRRISVRPSTPLVPARGRPPSIPPRPGLPKDLAAPTTPRRTEWLLLGASTGGPKLVCEMLKALPRLRVPIVVVQHITRGFTGGFAEWLGIDTGRRVEVVQEPRVAEANVAYVPADGQDLEIRSGQMLAPVAALSSELGPSVDVLFASAARCYGANVLAVLMTGMGRDGAAGLSALDCAGAVTVAQEPTTCVVDSMPRSAITVGAARHVLAPKQIVRLIAAQCAA